MAGDWIKMTTSLPDKPEVWAIASALEIDVDAVVGKLFRAWVWFDQNTENGNAPSVTKKILDRITHVTGFADAMIEAGWLTECNGTVSVPNFDRHNGKSSKERALTAKRVKRLRNGENVTESLPEKRREEKRINNNVNEYDNEFLEFWNSWPIGHGNKGNKQEAFAAWRNAKDLPPAADLIAAAKRQAALKSRQKQAGEFVEPFKHVCRWLKLRDWESAPAPVAKTGIEGWSK